jgi:hypothetical protein
MLVFLVVRGFYEQYVKVVETGFISHLGYTLQVQSKEKFKPPNLEQIPPKTLYLSDYMTSVIKMIESLSNYGEQRIYPSWTRSLDILLDSLISHVVRSYSQYHSNITTNHTTTVLFILLSDIEEVVKHVPL